MTFVLASWVPPKIEHESKVLWVAVWKTLWVYAHEKATVSPTLMLRVCGFIGKAQVRLMVAPAGDGDGDGGGGDGEGGGGDGGGR